MESPPRTPEHDGRGSESSGPRPLRSKSGLDAPVLVVDRHFRPVRLTTARQAFTLLFQGRARAAEPTFEPHDFESWLALPPAPPAHHADYVGTPRGPVRVPRLLVLFAQVRVSSSPLRLSRRTLFARDRYTCQYCLRRPGVRELNIDHVLPRSRGGRWIWENLVTSCRPCNLRKGWSTPEEAGMTLRAAPARPSWGVALRIVSPNPHYPEWEPFMAGADQADLFADLEDAWIARAGAG